jgi:hypothetical protein
VVAARDDPRAGLAEEVVAIYRPHTLPYRQDAPFAPTQTGDLDVTDAKVVVVVAFTELLEARMLDGYPSHRAPSPPCR